MLEAGFMNDILFRRACWLLGVSVEEIRSDRKTRDLVYRRVVLSRWLKSRGMRYEDIGKYLGRKHCCVPYYDRIFRNDSKTRKGLMYMDTKFSREIKVLEDKLI